jgi:2-dehydro-3-deoxyphosphogalactonate aldolase
MPGIATATEAFSAARAGATQLKLFPASTYGPQHLRALCTVLPKEIKIFPVGGVTAEQIPAWLAAGAAGFGFGSELFRPEYSLDDIKRRAELLVGAFLANSTIRKTHSGETI